MIKERPILFKPEMVSAIISGKKTVTRRLYSKKYDSWKAGDRLWVKERFAITKGKVIYSTDLPQDKTEKKIKWKPSLFMPKSYSRIHLEITSIRQDKLATMTTRDAIKEGIETSERNNALLKFQELWDKINGPGSFNSNPTVMIIEFTVMRVAQNE